MNLLKRSQKFSILVTAMTIAASAALAQNKGVEEEFKPIKGNEKESEVRALKTELLVAKTEGEALKQLDRLLGKYKGTPMEPTLWLRKAELYARMSKTERFFEISRESETVVSLAPQRVKAASPRKYLSLAVDTYDSIQRKFPNFRDLDVVLFNNAFTRQQLDQNKLSENLYRDLVSRFPDSDLVPDAHLALGEMLFERKNFQEALAEFNKIKKYPNSRVYPYGIYKAAWSRYNLHDPESGLKDLEAVVAFGRKVEADGLDAKLDLRNEALNDMVIFYGDVGEAPNAIGYFREQAGEKQSGALILRLAGLYARHAQFKEHDRVLGDWINKNPESVEVPAAYKSLVENHEVQRNREKAVSTLAEFDKVCDPKGSWTKANVAKDKSATSNVCAETISKVSLVHASKWHRMWKKNVTHPEFADQAEVAYKIYLKYTVAGTESWETRFSFAEMLFQREKYRDASEHYAVVGHDAQDPKLVHDGGYAALVSLEKSIKDKWSDVDEKRFGELADTYIKRNKNGQYVTDIRFKRAFIAYEKGRYDEAAPEFKDLGWTSRDSAFGEKAQMLYLDILNIKKRYADLRDYAQKLMGTNLTAARSAQIKKIYDEASFAEAQKLQEDGKHLRAAEAFEKFARDNKQSSLADKAWWNAIFLFSQEGQNLKSTEMAEKMGEMFPKSEHKREALLKAAQGYESMLDLKKAADVLSDLAVEDGAQAHKWKSLAADFYALSGMHERAASLYRQLSKSKEPGVAQGAYAKLLLLTTVSGSSPDSHLIQEIATSGVQPQASIAQAELADRAFQKNNHAEAFKLASKTLEMRKNGAATVALAKARMVQARILENEFRTQSVKARPDRVAVVLQLKTEKLDKAQAAFQDVVKIGEPKMAIAALKAMAGIYGHYVDSLHNFEVTGEVSKEDLAGLRKELDGLALPMEDKRVDLLNEALKQAKRMELRDTSVAEIQTEINNINLKRNVSQTAQITLPEVWLPKTYSGGSL